jgi:hypothetical protein
MGINRSIGCLMSVAIIGLIGFCFSPRISSLGKAQTLPIDPHSPFAARMAMQSLADTLENFTLRCGIFFLGNQSVPLQGIESSQLLIKWHRLRLT